MAANAERTPEAQWMTTGASLSGSLDSTEVSSVPRGMCNAPGIAPCSYSSGSRTSSTIAPLRLASSASAVSTSWISAFVAANRSRKLGMTWHSSLRRSTKRYRLGQQSGQGADSLDHGRQRHPERALQVGAIGSGFESVARSSEL